MQVRNNRGASDQQRGVVLVIILVILSSMSILVLGSGSESRLESAIVRNDQFRVNAYRVALSEINAQIQDININAVTEDDEAILQLIYRDNTKPWELSENELRGPAKGKGAYTQGVALSVLCDPDHCPAPAGYSLSGNTKVLRARIESSAQLHDTGAQSSQAQSFWYLLPQSGITTFE
ncbi:MAG: hypothetical protein KTR32_35515 [Granulosicoccus sp.]|nr:hypothetical protein [Granulosicoccus sp.]